jgi:hypothetical protein
MTTKQARNRLLNEVGGAVASLRRALEIAEKEEWTDFYAIQDQIDGLIDLSNLAEQIV